MTGTLEIGRVGGIVVESAPPLGVFLTDAATGAVLVELPAPVAAQHLAGLLIAAARDLARHSDDHGRTVTCIHSSGT